MAQVPGYKDPKKPLYTPPKVPKYLNPELAQAATTTAAIAAKQAQLGMSQAALHQPAQPEYPYQQSIDAARKLWGENQLQRQNPNYLQQQYGSSYVYNPTPSIGNTFGPLPVGQTNVAYPVSKYNPGPKAPVYPTMRTLPADAGGVVHARKEGIWTTFQNPDVTAGGGGGLGGGGYYGYGSGGGGSDWWGNPTGSSGQDWVNAMARWNID